MKMDKSPKGQGGNREDIKWYDRRLMIPSLVIAPLLFVLFYALAMRQKPSEGFVFERAPVISGIYKCCEAGGRYSASWVGDVSIDCRTVGYYEFIGTNRNDCGLKEQLNGQTVEVTRAYIPSSGERSPLVIRIISQGQIYYEIDDKRIRDLWIYASTTAAQTLAFVLTALLHGIRLIYRNRKTSIRGES